jgi:hypothetical protein
MIRPVSLISLIAAAGAGLYLYQVKHSVSMLDRELREVNRQTEVVRERTQILRAEWALLNDPDRLRQVAHHHLALEPMAPAQFIREAELDSRLPAPLPFAGPKSLFDAPVSSVEMLVSPMAPSLNKTVAAPVPPPAMARTEAPPRQPPTEPAPRLNTAAPSSAASRPSPPPAPPRLTQALHVAPVAPSPPALITSALGGTSGALPPPVPLARPGTVGAPQGAGR